VGLRNWLHNKSMKEAVPGSYQLTSCSAGVSGAAYSNCHMEGVVTGPGVGPVAVDHYCTAPTSKWPSPGRTLPVTVDRADPTRMRVRWDDMPSNRDLGREQARQAAEHLARQIAQGTGQQPGNPFGAVPLQVQPVIDAISQAARRAGMNVTFDQSSIVLGDPGRAAPGAPGGGLTPQEAAAAVAGNGAAVGLQPATARVLAVHEVPVPAGLPGGPPAGLFDLTLDVTTATGLSYSTRTRIGFLTPARRDSVAVVGAVLPAFADPVNRDRIAIDTSKLD
jgi:hypothetical protein